MTQRLLACRTVVLLALSFAVPGQALAQLSDSDQPSAADRELLFQELAAEVDALQTQFSLLKKVVRLATPSVVHIEAAKPQGPGQPAEEAGSGVIVEIDEKLYVITNRHVIDQSPISRIKIQTADGRALRATNGWADRETDVAVLALRQTDLTPARIAEGTQVEIGDFVLAVGSPFGLSHSVTYGIIGAKGRRDLKLGDGSIRYQDFLQTDAAINPGNSGGPLLNLRGEVIGINTAIASSSGGSEGIGFTIPVDMAITVARQFIQHGRPVRAYLGVNLGRNFGPEQAARLGLPRPQGAVISSIVPNSPADKAGLKPDDVVLEFDSHHIEDDDHLIKVVGFTAVGKKVPIIAFRDGELVTFDITLTERRPRYRVQSPANPR